MKDGMLMTVAEVAVETGIPPQSLLDCEPDLFRAVLKVVNTRRAEHNRAAKRRA